MKSLATASLILPAALIFAACSAHETTSSDELDPGSAVVAQEEGTGVHVNAVTEAPTGFDGLSNGFVDDPVDFAALGDVFAEVDAFEDGLGPVFNNVSCISCHQNPTPAIGSGSQISELRAGHLAGNTFVEHQGGSLINERANDRSIQEHILSGNEVQTERLTLSVMGDGFVESIDSNTLQAISLAQPAAQRGTVIQVPVEEAGGLLRVGRFGWKNQQASLTSFAGDAYINEIGVTNRLFPTENTSNGTVVQGGRFDGKTDVEDTENDIDEFAEFMRSTKAPPRGPITQQVTTGQGVFIAVGCAVCHLQNIVTAPAGTVINQGTFTVPTALGDKRIHPFGDYLLHNIGTGDGIVQNGGQGTRLQVRTAPLWGIGSRTRFMHDGRSLTVGDAISRHRGQADTSRLNFNARSAADQAALVAFVFSL